MRESMAGKIRRLCQRKAELLRLHAAGLTREAIAARMDVQKSRVSKWLTKLGLSTRRRRRRAKPPCRDCGRVPDDHGRCCEIGYHNNSAAAGASASSDHEGHAERMGLYTSRAGQRLPLFTGEGG